MHSIDHPLYYYEFDLYYPGSSFWIGLFIALGSLSSFFGLACLSAFFLTEDKYGEYAHISIGCLLIAIFFIALFYGLGFGLYFNQFRYWPRLEQLPLTISEFREYYPLETGLLAGIPLLVVLLVVVVGVSLQHPDSCIWIVGAILLILSIVPPLYHIQLRFWGRPSNPLDHLAAIDCDKGNTNSYNLHPNNPSAADQVAQLLPESSNSNSRDPNQQMSGGEIVETSKQQLSVANTCVVWLGVFFTIL